METIFASLCAFLLAHQGDIASKVIASAAYDGLKKVLNFSSLKERIKKFFKTNEEADTYIETICKEKSVNPTKPYRDIEDSFEKLTGAQYNDGLFEEIKKWIEENKETIISVSKMEQINESGFNIGVQNAGKNIYNIQGDYHKKD